MKNFLSYEEKSMSARFQELFRLQPKLYLEGSPIIIEAGALHKDTSNDKVLAQLKFRNISSKHIIACKVTIRAYEPSDTEVEGVNNFSYLDVDAPTGSDFGSKTPIYLPNNNTRRFTVAVTEVVFNDNIVMRAEWAEWSPIPVQKTIAETFHDFEMVKQYELEAGSTSTFVPMLSKGLFLCTCGAANLASSERCYKCNKRYDDLSRIIDEEYLTQKKNARLEKEREEREAAERAEREAEEAKRIKAERQRRKTRIILSIALPIVAGVAIIAALTPTVIKPAIDNLKAYEEATLKLKSGAYDDAKDAFEALGDYKDSSTMVLESQYEKADALSSQGDYENAITIWTSLGEYSDSKARIETAKSDWKEADYQSAQSLMDEKMFKEASVAFKALGDYKDSKTKSEECLELKKENDYQMAIASFQSGDYVSAIIGFRELAGYKDADSLFLTTSYDYACGLAEKGDYYNAITYFAYAGGYNDANDLRIDAIYKYACQLLDNNNYVTAVAQFNTCSDYKDSASKINDAKYGYVTTHMDRNDSTTFSYLKDLKSAGYSGASTIYYELYEWKVEVTAINNSENSTINMSSVSRYDTVYFHFKVTGGAPGETEEIKAVASLPTIASGHIHTFTLSNGGASWVSVYYTSGHSSGTCYATFYDSNGNQIGKGSIRMD